MQRISQIKKIQLLNGNAQLRDKHQNQYEVNIITFPEKQSLKYNKTKQRFRR